MDNDVTVNIGADAGSLMSELEKVEQMLAQLLESGNKAAKGLGKGQEKAAKESAANWMQVLGPVDRAFDGMLKGVLTGTQSFHQAMTKMWSSLALSAIDAGTKALTHELANLAAGVTAHKAAETGKSLATEQGEAQRSAAEDGGFLGWLGKIGESIAEWLGLETGKSAATDAGAAERLTAQSAEAAAGHAIAVTAAVANITTDAAVAAAGAASAVASIPYIGPILAPAAAAEAFGSTMGWAAIASAEGGMYEVPGEILSVLHPQESVLPASVAQPMRDFFAGGAGSGTGSGGQTVVIAPQVSAMDGRSVLAALNDPQTMRGMATQLSAYWRLNPSARPAF